MSALHALQGAHVLLLICLLLFAEEAGVPLPFAPGEGVLIGAGLLVASGSEPLWLVLALTYLAALGGALTGYVWAGLVGPVTLLALATRIHADRPYERVASRLRSAGPLEIAISRLIPGLRIYTTLVAGAVGVRARLFLPAIAPAVAVWVTIFTLLGVFMGVPAERLLGRLEAYILKGVVIAGVVAIGYLAFRKLPPAPSRPAGRQVLWRTVAALVTDSMTLIIMVAVLGLATGFEVGEPDTITSSVVTVSAVALLYVFVLRRSLGHTVGEALFDTRYPAGAGRAATS